MSIHVNLTCILLLSLSLLALVHPLPSPDIMDQSLQFESHSNRLRRHSPSPPAPKKFTTNPYPGQNMDKALGMKKKKTDGSSSPSSSKYPWDSTQNKNVKLHYTDSMKQFIREDEETFRDDYYEDYDFEFPKGMIRNDNFETKKNKEMARRLEEGV